MREHPVQDRVFLVGFMGSGKSAVGRLLAERRGVPFFDTDAWVERRVSKSVAALFQEEGEAHFRELEAAALAEACQLPKGVVATGGGLFVVPEHRDRIRAAGVSVWLDTPISRIWERCRGLVGRPLFGSRAEMESLLEARRPSYALADWRVDVGDRSAGEVADEVERLLFPSPKDS